MLSGLLLARGHQRRSPHQKSRHRRARRTWRDDESRGAAPPRPCRVRQARTCTGSFHLYVAFSLAKGQKGVTRSDTWARFCSQRRVRGTIRAATASARSPSCNEGKTLGIEKCCRGAPRPRRPRRRYRDGRYVKTKLSIITFALLQPFLHQLGRQQGAFDLASVVVAMPGETLTAIAFLQ